MVKDEKNVFPKGSIFKNDSRKADRRYTMRGHVRYMAAVLAAGALILTGCSGTGAGTAQSGAVNQGVQSQGGETASVSVSATEKTELTPDMAELGIGVTNEAATVEAATSENSAKVNEILDALRALGYTDDSLSTSDIGLYPQYDYSGGESVLTGYRMDTTITVSDVPADTVGDVLGDALSHGANTINSIRYFSSSYDEAYKESLSAAIASAEEKASAMAEASGLELDGILSMTEHASGDYARYSGTNGYMDYGTGNARAEAAALDVAVVPGTVAAEASVTVVFALK